MLGRSNQKRVSLICVTISLETEIKFNLFINLILLTRRSPRGHKLLPVVAGRRRSAMRSVHRASLGLSGFLWPLGVRGRGVPVGRLPRGHPLVDLGVHVHVDLRGSLSRS